MIQSCSDEQTNEGSVRRYVYVSSILKVKMIHAKQTLNDTPSKYEASDVFLVECSFWNSINEISRRGHLAKTMEEFNNIISVSTCNEKLIYRKGDRQTRKKAFRIFVCKANRTLPVSFEDFKSFLIC